MKDTQHASHTVKDKTFDLTNCYKPCNFHCCGLTLHHLPGPSEEKIEGLGCRLENKDEYQRGNKRTQPITEEKTVEMEKKLYKSQETGDTNSATLASGWIAMAGLFCVSLK